MKFSRVYSKPSESISIRSQVKWKFVDCEIKDSKGKTIFSMPNVEVPEPWSQNAANILAQKYFRKAGVPNELVYDTSEAIVLPGLWLYPSRAAHNAILGSETSADQVFHRLAGAWTYWGWKEKIFTSETDALIFYSETYLMLANQVAAPNSPQWFNTGLHWAYGISGPASGQWITDEKGEAWETSNSYERPQPHACFIQPVADDLVNPGGIMDLWTREVRLFKQGSGTGTNFSNIRARGERLSGGGISSGLMSFLPIGDRTAGSIASGGTTRRAAKMVCLNADHPEIEDFIAWKVKEENKAAMMYVGSKLVRESLEQNKASIPQAMLDRLNAGKEQEIYSIEFEGEAINTVSGQNSNNSIRLSDEFMSRVEQDGDWNLTSRTDGKVIKTLKARDLWNQICYAAWACADPGLQFDDTINSWNTAANDARINATNPCSEYNFLDNTACNLASLNLCKFETNSGFDPKLFAHATRIWTVVLEISIHMASFPSKEIALGTYNYRTLGLGYANLGALLMQKAIAYDSNAGRNYAAGITALMHGVAYATSAEIAESLGPFPRWEANKEVMKQVINKHIEAKSRLNFQELSAPMVKEIEHYYQKLKANTYGYRNAQVTLIAPTGTISFVMDCDTTGLEPDFALVKYKKLSGGGNIKIVNESVIKALKKLNYTSAQIMSIEQHIRKNESLETWKVNGKPMPEEHLKVFDCAVGTRSLAPMAHVLMVAAVQPFLSGGVSKTINLPSSASVEDVSNVYMQAYKFGVKCIALYRDGSKLSQPLSNKQEIQEPQTFVLPPPTINITPFNSDPVRRLPLPMRRKGYTQKVRIDGQTVYLSTGEYPNGRLGEIFIELSREGSTVRALVNSFAKAISIGIQYGVPLEEYIESFIYTKFEPSGIVEGHEKIKICSSIFDLVFRELAINYLNQNEYADVELKTQEQEQEQEQIPIPLATGTNGTITSNPNIRQKSKALLNICWNCHQPTLIKAGTCFYCTNCNSNTGCG